MRHPLFRSAMLFALLSVVACHDRIIKVTCGPSDNDTISADFGSPNIAGISIGLLNTHQFSPGTLLQLSPAPAGQTFGSGAAPYVLDVKDSDFAPAQPEATISKVVSADFSVEAGADVTAAATAASIDLKTEINSNTTLTATNAQRKTLRDPLGLLSLDSRAMTILKQGTDSKFVVVSAVSIGDSVSLGYKGSTSVSGNADVKVGKFNLTINYDCSDVASINQAASGAGAQKASLLFFYVPVKLGADGAVQVDTAAPDLTKYRFVAADMMRKH
jgi:hypothetical protein